MTPATAVAPCLPSGAALPTGTRLRDYEITGLVGEGGFGVVYAAWDQALQRRVAIKEYWPAALASRAPGSTAVVVATTGPQRDAFCAGLKSFVDEARRLARFDHPSLLKVYRFWEEHGTAYRVMPLYEGPTLAAALVEPDHVPGEAELRGWLRPVLDALARLHEGAAVHGNVSPRSIVLTATGPVLLGCAGARHAVAMASPTPASALHPGHAALEQYDPTAARLGPWTDLYALASVVYRAVTGAAPPAAPDRLGADPLKPLAVVAAGLYSAGFLAAVDAALALQPEARPRDHLAFRRLMGDIDAPTASAALAPRRDPMQEPFLSADDGGREVTVPDRPLIVGASAARSEAIATAAGTAATTSPRLPPLVLPERSTADAGRRSRPPVQADDPRAPSPASPRPFAARRRLVYGALAAACGVLGIAALVHEIPSPPARPAGAGGGSAASMAGAGTATPTLARASAAAGVATASGRDAASPAPAALASAGTDIGTGAPATAAVVPTSPSSAPTLPSSTSTPTPASPLDRQARCTEILQKASLEPIGAAETDFFKKECK